jgi:hypothetical protein
MGTGHDSLFQARPSHRTRHRCCSPCPYPQGGGAPLPNEGSAEHLLMPRHAPSPPPPQIGQADAKRAVAVAFRNRWRRHRVPQELRGDITPKNILMIGACVRGLWAWVWVGVGLGVGVPPISVACLGHASSRHAGYRVCSVCCFSRCLAFCLVFSGGLEMLNDALGE